MSVGLQLLTKVLESKKDLLTVQQAGISGSHFEGEAREMWEWITNYAFKYGTVPEIKRLQEEFPAFKPSKPYAPINDLIERVRVSAQETYLSAAILKISELIGDGKGKEAIDVYQTTWASLSSFSSPGQVSSFRDTASSRYSQYKKSLSEGFNPMGIRIGIDPIDETFLGLQPGDYVPVAGRLEVGKSTFAQAMCCSFYRQNKRTLVFSFEMKAQLYLAKLDSMMARIPYRAMRELGLSGLEVKKWKKSIDRLAGKDADIIVVDNILKPTPSTLATYIDIHSPDVVIIDQVPLMKADIARGERYGASWEATTTLSRQLKQLAFSKNVPVIALTQSSRAAVEKGVRIETIGYSDAIAQDGDKVLGIDKGVEPNERIFAVLKNRDFGTKVAVTVVFDPEKMIYKVLRSEPLYT